MDISITNMSFEELKQLIALIKGSEKEIGIETKLVLPKIPVEDLVKKDLNPIPTPIPLPESTTPVEKVTIKELAELVGLDYSTIAKYRQTGIITPIPDTGRHLFDKEATIKTIAEYRQLHPTAKEKKNLKNREVSPEEPVKITETTFREWKSDICKRIELANLKPNQVLSEAFKTLTKRYGIVWAQEEKDYLAKKGHRPYSTIQTAYFMENEGDRKKTYHNLIEGVIDNIIANGGVYNAQ